VEELTERVSALHRENALLESALEAARSRDEEVHGPLSAVVFSTIPFALEVSAAQRRQYIPLMYCQTQYMSKAPGKFSSLKRSKYSRNGVHRR